MRTPVYVDDSPTVREMRSWAPQPARRDGASTRGQVLVVAADRAVATAVQCVLDDVCDVVECSDPREAVLGIVRGDEYDVILCDVDVPFVPAQEFRAQVAAVDAALAERFIILGTELRDAPDKSAHLSKPLDVQTLKRTVAELVSLRTLPPRRSSRR